MHTDFRSVFMPLVRHEFKSQANRNQKEKMSRAWILIHAIFLVAVLLILATYFSLSFRIQLNPLWNIGWGIPWITFVLSIRKIRLEWVSGTSGWWLSLPYSRHLLVFAKFLALIARGFLITSGISILMLLIGGYASLINGQLDAGDFFSFMYSGGLPMLIDYGALPLAASAGLFNGIMNQTRWRPGMNIFWLLFSVLWAIAGTNRLLPSLTNIDRPIVIYYGLIISWGLALFLLFLSARLLEKKLDP